MYYDDIEMLSFIIKSVLIVQGKTSTAMYNDDELESFAYVDNLEAL